MDRAEIEAELRREPFVPLRIRLKDGRLFDVPFRHVIVFQRSRLILFVGVKKEASHAASGFELLPYDQIDRIEQRRGQAGGRRKKAS